MTSGRALPLCIIHPAVAPATLPRMNDRRGLLLVHLALLMTAVIWGGNFAAMKYLIDALGPVDVMVVRCLAGALFFLAVLSLAGRPLPRMRPVDLLRLALLGVLGVTTMNLAMAYGMHRISAALASLIMTSNPIFTAVISLFLTGERLTRRKVGGIATATAGFLIVLLFGSPGGAQLDINELTGVLIILMAPLAWACYTVLSKPLLATYPSLHVAAYAVIAGGLVFLPVALLFEHDLPRRVVDLGWHGWTSVLYVSLMALVVAYILWYWGLRALTPSQTAVYSYLVPVFGILAAWLVLGSPPTAFLLLGGAVIVAGVVLTNSDRQTAPATRLPTAAEPPPPLAVPARE